MSSSKAFFFFLCFLGPHLLHMEVPRLGVQSELQLLAYTTAIATWDPSLVCDLYHSSWLRQILNPLRETRDSTCILMDTSWVVTTAPQQELPKAFFFFFFYSVFDLLFDSFSEFPSLITLPSCSCILSSLSFRALSILIVVVLQSHYGLIIPTSLPISESSSDTCSISSNCVFLPIYMSCNFFIEKVDMM